MKIKKCLQKIVAMGMLIALMSSSIIGNQCIKVKGYATSFHTSYSAIIDGIKWSVGGTYHTETDYLETEEISAELVNKTQKNIVIPDELTYGHAKITKVPMGLFRDNESVESVVLGENIEYINSVAFEHCKNLKKVVAKNKEKPIGVGVFCFYGCDSLELVDFTVGEISLWGFEACSSLKKIESFDGECMETQCFKDSGIETISISENCSKLSIGREAFKDSQLVELRVPCDVELEEGAFSNCPRLTDLTFMGKVKISDKSQEAIFANSFSKEYGEDGKLKEKKVEFQGDVKFREYENNEVGDFGNCTGLTSVTFGDRVCIAPRTFVNCPMVKEMNFYGYTELMNESFFGLKKLEELVFRGGVYNSNNVRPFEGSTIKRVHFMPEKQVDVTCNIDATTIEEIVYGPKVENIGGTIEEHCNVKRIRIENPTIAERSMGGYLMASERGAISLIDKQTAMHDVYGYSSIYPNERSVESWTCGNSKAIFNNLVMDNVAVADELTYVGSVEKKDIPFDKLQVQYASALNPMERLVAPHSESGIDHDGYIVDTSKLPDTLTPGSYKFQVFYSGRSGYGTVLVEDIKPIELFVQWNRELLNDLVAGQRVKVEDVVKSVTVAYNNGERVSITDPAVLSQKLTLNKSMLSEGNNALEVSYKECLDNGNEVEIKSKENFSINSNYVTSISAKYIGEALYVGDQLEPEQIDVILTYKNGEDARVTKKVKPTKIEAAVLSKAGKNEVVVWYNEFSTVLQLEATAVIPLRVSANFDKSNCYREGQEGFEVESFAITVEYNNGTVKDNYNKKNLVVTEKNVTIEEKTRTSLEVSVILSYSEEGVTVTSQEILIPITPTKITGIKVISSVNSAMEQSILPYSCISQLEVFYDNGTSRVFQAGEIKEEELQFLPYQIVANQLNTIKVEYKGFIGEFSVFGIANTVVGIRGSFLGESVLVGDYVKPEQFLVEIIKKDGTIETVKAGIVLENDKIVNVGDNTVIVHFGEFKAEVTVVGSAVVEMPDEDVPKETNKPLEIDIPEDNVPNNTVNTATGAGVITIGSNVSSIKLTNKKSYHIYTNKKVMLAVSGENISDISYQLVSKGEKPLASAWKSLKENAIIIKATKKPSVVYFQYKDSNGQLQKAFTEGFLIDKKKPTVNVSNGKKYAKGKKLTMKDAGSGIKSAKLDGKSVKTGYKMKKTGKHKLVLMDRAGNKTSVSFVIK